MLQDAHHVFVKPSHFIDMYDDGIKGMSENGNFIFFNQYYEFICHVATGAIGGRLHHAIQKITFSP